MELLEDGGVVVEWGSSGNDTSGRILDQLKLMEGFVRELKEKRIYRKKIMWLRQKKWAA